MEKQRAKIIITSMIIGLMFLHSISCAATRTWVGSISEVWSDAGNWLEGAIPGAADDVIFDLTNSLQGCTLDISTTIGSLYIEADFGYVLTFPLGTNLSIRGDIDIGGGTWATLWDNACTITLSGDGDQHITIGNYVDWKFYNLTINKPLGVVVLYSNIIVSNIYSLVVGPIDYNGHIIVGGCIVPKTGAIHHVSNQ